ncbi:MAG: epoxyqueuosine reductase QueH [Lachnospiraceae bacterium]|nr:epoxyqueuosine reductase QueH [Lachnospiraceae bacterium]
MNAVRNYQKELDKIIESIGADDKSAPTLFLHSCCAPCSSYVLEYLRTYFRITVFYYNPNISMEEEYRKRVAEQKRLISAYNEALLGNSVQTQEKNINNRSYLIDVVEGDYEPQSFYEIARGLELCPEGGERCFVCYELRLRETAKRAQAGKYDYFATTLTISPLKNAVKLNEIGERLAAEYGVSWLPSDFKKKGGYQRSIELSKEYDLYRQDYCGCVYSKEERERQRS